MKKFMAIALTLIMVFGFIPLVGTPASARVETAVWSPTFYDFDAGDNYVISTENSNQGQTGIQRVDPSNTTVTVNASNELEITAVGSSYKTMRINTPTAIGGTDWYSYHGFKPVADKEYKITFNARLSDGTGNIRVRGNAGKHDTPGAGVWQEFGLTTTNSVVAHTFTQTATGGDVQIDTGNVDPGVTITITNLVIYELSDPPKTTLTGSTTTIPTANLQAGAGVDSVSSAGVVIATGSWTQRSVSFHVEWDGASLANYESLTFTYTGISGDFNFKNLFLLADGTQIATTSTGDAGGSGSAITFNIAAATGTPTTFTIRVGSATASPPSGMSASSMSYTNISMNKLCNHVWDTSLPNNHTQHRCTEADCIYTAWASHNTTGTGGACAICNKAPIFNAITHLGATLWNGSLTQRGIALSSASRAALREAGVEAATVKIVTGNPEAGTMQFAANSDGPGTIPVAFDSADFIRDKEITVDLSDVDVNWAGDWVEFGLNYSGTTPFTFSIELLNADGEVVFDKDGVHEASGGGGTGPGPTTPDGDVIYEMTAAEIDSLIQYGGSTMDVLRKAGSPTLTREGNTLVISNRGDDWHTIDINTKSTLFQAGFEYIIEIDLELVDKTKTTTFILGQASRPWGWAASEADVSATKLVLDRIVVSDWAKDDQNIRIQTNDTNSFVVKSIKITEIFVGLPVHVEIIDSETVKILGGQDTQDFIDGARDGAVYINLLNVANMEALPKGIINAVIPNDALQDFLAAGMDVIIRMPDGMIVIPKAALSDILDEAGGVDVMLTIQRVSKDDLEDVLNEEQLKALPDDAAVFNITLTANGVKITEFSGFLRVSLPWTGGTPASVWLLDNDGKLVPRTIPTGVAQRAGWVTFDTPSLSIYIIRHTPGPGTAKTGVVTFLGIAGALLVASGTGALIITRKMKKQK